MDARIKSLKEKGKTFTESQILDWLVQTVNYFCKLGLSHLLSSQHEDSAQRLENAKPFLAKGLKS